MKAMRIAAIVAIVGIVATPAFSQLQQPDRRLDLSTQPTYAPFGQMPQDYRDSPSLYSSGNVRYGRAFTGNRNFLEDRYFSSPITRFQRDSFGSYDVYGGGRQFGAAQPYYAPGSLVSRGDLGRGATEVGRRPDPFGIAASPPPSFAGPVDPELDRRVIVPGSGPRAYTLEPSADNEDAYGFAPRTEVPWMNQEGMRNLQAAIAAQEAVSDMFGRGPFGTPLPLQWQMDPTAGSVEGELPNPWILLPEEVRQGLTPEEVEPPQNGDPMAGIRQRYWEDQEQLEADSLPPWMTPGEGRSMEDRLREGEAERDSFGETNGEERSALTPDEMLPQGGPLHPANFGQRAIRVGRINLQVGLYRQAIEQFERAATFDRSLREEANRLEGHAHLLIRGNRMAALLISDSIENSPELYGRDYRLTTIVENQELWQQAVERIGRQADDMPRATMYQFLHGYLLYGLGRHGEAEPYLKAAAVEGSQYAEAARALLKQGEAQEQGQEQAPEQGQEQSQDAAEPVTE